MVENKGDTRNGSCPIQVVSRRTGLSPEVLRIWEKRYGVVTPRRSPSGRRQYSESEIKKLHLLQLAVASGHRIGELCSLGVEELDRLVREEARATAESNREHGAGNGRILDSCIKAVKELDGPVLQSLLNRAQVSMDGHAFVEELLAPLFSRIGQGWETGEMETHHEHLATSTVRNILARFLAQTPEDLTRKILVATPAGHHHEIGALLVAVTSVLAGYRVLYFGTNLPAADIVSAVKKTKANMVALSVVYPARDTRTLTELKTVCLGLPPGIRMIVGGQSAGHYAPALEKLGVWVISDLKEFGGVLETRVDSGNGKV